LPRNGLSNRRSPVGERKDKFLSQVSLKVHRLLQFADTVPVTLTAMPYDLAAAALAGLATHGGLSAAVVRNGRIAWASAGFVNMFGLGGSNAVGTPVAELVAAGDRETIAKAITETPGITLMPTQACALRADGSQFDAEFSCAALELPGGPGAVIMVRDVTEQRRTETRLSELAFSDPLTELPNRALFFDRLRQTLVDARRHGTSFAVLVGDLDGFKQVNDRYGHETGDALLQAAAKRLRAALREGDTVARTGGDEFAALLPRASNQEEAAIVAKRIVGSLDTPIVVAGQQCVVGFSAGLALYPADGKDIDTLLAHADSAMYAAKRAGGKRFEFVHARRADITGPLRLPAFEWHESYAVGVPVMDEGHKTLAALVNRLGEELKAGHDAERVRESLRKLEEVARAHFVHEEWLIANAGLHVAAERHKHEQRALMEELESQSLQLGGRSMALTMRYLNGWLARHIERDRPYARELLEQGLRV
jgi:diguanylate cyclase (GGDEF)-like protein/hemerythrin-like metal-binding protein/PAS domain S-box-containing protein